MNKKLSVGSLFSGIGGIDLGLESTGGFKVDWQVEIDEFAQRVLRKQFPEATLRGDIRDCHGWRTCGSELRRFVADAGRWGSEPSGQPILSRWDALGVCSAALADADEERLQGGGVPEEPREDVCDVTRRGHLSYVDVVTAGWPCQPVSHAGRRQGDADVRWLWPSVVRVLDEVRPRYFLGENVPGLLSMDSGRLFGGVLRDLATLGFNVEWDCIPAAAVGAPHQRDRVFIVGWRRPHSSPPHPDTDVPDPEGYLLGAGSRAVEQARVWWRKPGDSGGWQAECRLGKHPDGIPGGLDCGGWECGVPRITTTQSDRVSRLKVLGNSVVPQVVAYVGQLITDHSELQRRTDPA